MQLTPQLERQLAHALLAPRLAVRASQLVLRACQIPLELLRAAPRLARLGGARQQALHARDQLLG